AACSLRSRARPERAESSRGTRTMTVGGAAPPAASSVHRDTCAYGKSFTPAMVTRVPNRTDSRFSTVCRAVVDRVTLASLALDLPSHGYATIAPGSAHGITPP